jgi:hypothetical protein
MTTARLNGFYAPEFASPDRQVFPVGSLPSGMERAPRTVDIADARAMQAMEGVSEAAFFARHGFVLLAHASAVRDWDAEVDSVYSAEIEKLIAERLLPGRRVEVQQAPNVLRRGRGTANPDYADGVHSDGGLDADDYAHNIGAFAGDGAVQWWRSRYDRDEAAGLIWIDFWRPTNMSGPLDHMPLALCDPTTVEAGDLVRTGMTGIAPEGRESHHLSLRFNAGQRWYYYPRMTCDELIAFKLAEFWKDPTPTRNCFHSAFHHPDTPPDAEERQSCEHRVGVMVFRD